MTPTAPPPPTAERWKPLRAGLVDLYHYDDQEFAFHDGRLLLRGNNGAGKSKVLALMLPFLLDGEMAGHRLEPDGDPAKKMEWNLLLGGEHPHPERTGYTWLELGRVDADGVEHHATIGAGIKAVRGRGVVRRWFFTADARVGHDLHLTDPATRTVLTQDRLADALEGRGRIVESARAYRALVDERFFGLGEVRYAALVDLLVQLRQPQLSRRPSESRLSDALTSALPPLDQAVLSDVAETFRSLEEDRATLERAATAHAAAGTFLGHYRRYARAAARRAAQAPRLTQSRHERTSRDLTAAQADAEAAQSAHDDAQDALEAAGALLEVLAVRATELAQDPRHRSVTAVEDARAAASRAGEDLAAATARTDQARARLEAATAARDAAAAEARVAREAADRAAGALAEPAATAGVPAPDALVVPAGPVGPVGPVGSAADAAGPADATDATDVDAAARAGADVVRQRRAALARVRSAVRERDGAAQSVERALGEVERLETEDTDLAARHQRSIEERAAAADAHLAAVRAHLGATTQLAVGDVEGVLADLAGWARTLDGPSPAARAVSLARDARTGAMAEQRAELRQQGAAADGRAERLRADLARLESGGHLPPEPSPTRDPARRAGRAGAPLWRLVDVAPTLDDGERAGLEAALEGAGLLDAWVGPDGELLGEAGEGVVDDVLLRALPPRERPVSSLLGALTVSLPEGDQGAASPSPGPSEGALPSAQVVSDVLASIALVADADADADADASAGPAGSVWVCADGRFGSPVATGSWHKGSARHLGAGARERARTAALTAARAELAGVEQHRYDLADALDALGRAARVLADEAEALPGPAALVAADAAAVSLAAQREALRPRSQAAGQALERARAALADVQAELTEAAEDLRLPPGADALDAVAEALHRYELALATLWPARRALRRAETDLARRGEQAADDEAAVDQRAQESRRAAGDAAAADERLDVLSRTVGAEAAELLAELEQVRERRRAAQGERAAADSALRAALERRGAAGARRDGLARELETTAAARADAVEALRRFASTGLLAVAVPEVEHPDPAQPWAPDPAVRLARRLDAALVDVAVEDEAWERVQSRVTGEARVLDDVLAVDGHRAVLYVRDDGIVVDVTFRGHPSTVLELEEALGADVAARTELLDSREREVIESYLVDEVASTLAELITDAEAQVARMNAELERRPTSTGMRLRLVWTVREDGPPGLSAARERLLRQSADAWSATDRAAVGDFLQGQIRAVRAADPGGAWLDQLTRALDHRSWHRFAIQRRQNGQWRSATGPASGGEKVLAASVPLFAAASAHYGSAPNPLAPRLITLDEAFAGVDDTARADYLGLLAAFDLDVVMTSEREWGCYPQVPGLGISQLSRVEGVDAVLVTPWRWDGRELSQTPQTPQASPAATDAEGGQDALWP